MAVFLLAISAVLVVYAYRQPAGVAVVKIKREARRQNTTSLNRNKFE
ncbi:hypothetical protein [Maritalea sp.]